MAWRQSDYAAAMAFGEQGLALWRSLADVRGIVLSLHVWGTAAYYQGDYTRVATLGEASLAAAQ